MTPRGLSLEVILGVGSSEVEEANGSFDPLKITSFEINS